MKGYLSPMYFSRSEVTKFWAQNDSSFPADRSTATLAISHMTPMVFLKITLWRVMSTDLHKSGTLAASNHEWHTRPAPIRISMAPSLAKITESASTGSSDQSLSSDAGKGIVSTDQPPLQTARRTPENGLRDQHSWKNLRFSAVTTTVLSGLWMICWSFTQ